MRSEIGAEELSGAANALPEFRTQTKITKDDSREMMNRITDLLFEE